MRMEKVGLLWLEGLSVGSINNCQDLCKAFIDNFQATYVRPGNRWDLAHIRQHHGKMLRKYVNQFFDNRNQLSVEEDHDVINNYLSGLHNRATWRAMFQARHPRLRT